MFFVFTTFEISLPHFMTEENNNDSPSTVTQHPTGVLEVMGVAQICSLSYARYKLNSPSFSETISWIRTVSFYPGPGCLKAD